MRRTVDRPFLVTTLLLVAAGFFIFSSASLGLLARDGVHFSSLLISQLVLGVGLGAIALVLLSRVHYRIYRRYAPHIFIASILLALSVFLPWIGYEAGGARRWISVLGISFQPAEFLKIGYVIFMASFLATHQRNLHEFQYGLVPFAGILLFTGLILLLQPDTGTFIVIAASGLAMYIAAGAKLRDLFLLFLGFLVLLMGVATVRPYVMDRLLTFVNPAVDPLDSGYQLRQSLIAVGSGGWVGRGFGQSIQKFSYLPEPVGDSIFSVAAEEFGFLGSVVLIGLFLFFALRGLKIAARARDRFGGLLVIGLVILIVSQSFINIGSMIGVLPLTGLPLIFVSHGGSALLFALAAVGVVLNVSKYSTVHEKRLT